MPHAEFTTPLSIIQCKSGDQVIFETDETTPYEFTLTVKNLAGSTLYGPVSPDLTRDGVHYWFLTANASYGFSSVLTYYQVEIEEDVTGDVLDSKYIVYVNDHLAFENYLLRALGLAGHNARRYSHTWSRGLLSGFQLKFYSTAADLSAAIAGTSDNYIAHYAITIRYNSSYNRIELTSVKQ